MMNTHLRTRWYPIASSEDLPSRHVFHGMLLGREYAVWRADDGYVNVWENRCLHRGVRLSIGINEGSELKCQYHGWRYANRTAGCTYIPAHPADAPAQSICNNTYPVREAYGMVWTGEQAEGELPVFTNFNSSMALRPIPLNAPADSALQELIHYQFAENCTHTLEEDGAVTITAPDGTAVRLYAQPQDSNLTVIRGLINRTFDDPERIAVLRQHSRLMGLLRDQLELALTDMPVPEAMVAEIVLQSGTGTGRQITSVAGSGRQADLRVQVKEKTATAEGIVRIRLESIQGQLPTWQPGAHIDVHLQNGLVRQYSLTNGPGQTDHYTIGVKLEPDSAGGSIALHQHVQEGDVLAISAPRNNFPLRRDAIHTVFVAGGIGVTPLLSMAQALKAMKLNFEFHYFVQSVDHVAFSAVVDDMASSATVHPGLSPEGTSTALTKILCNYGPARHAYVCGPGPMLDAAREIARSQGWPDEAVHFEYFKNTLELDQSTSFDIDLARSAVTLSVPAGKSILEVLRENGIEMPSSCEQGACGTCKVRVLEGDVLHQDVYLHKAERAAGTHIITCVSRATSNRLILDI